MAATDVTGDGVLTPLGNGLRRLPDEEVQWVLRRRREDVPPDLFGPECVEAVNAVRDEFFEYQAWLRAEYHAHGGCVLVDEQFVKDRQEHQQWMSCWSARLTDLDLGELKLRRGLRRPRCGRERELREETVGPKND